MMKCRENDHEIRFPVFHRPSSDGVILLQNIFDPNIVFCTFAGYIYIYIYMLIKSLATRT